SALLARGWRARRRQRESRIASACSSTWLCPRQNPGHFPMPPGFEGPGIDSLVIRGVHIARVADGLGVGGGLFAQQRDLVLRKSELVERWDLHVLGQLVHVLHRGFGGFP